MRSMFALRRMKCGSQVQSIPYSSNNNDIHDLHVHCVHPSTWKWKIEIGLGAYHNITTHEQTLILKHVWGREAIL